MNYEDDELERMRARREQRRNASQSGSGRGTDTRRSADVQRPKGKHQREFKQGRFCKRNCRKRAQGAESK